MASRSDPDDDAPVAPRPGLAALLDLEAHPEGGWYRRIWAAPTVVVPPGYGGGRSTATAIHYVLGPGERSAWHRVRSDELWVWQRGVPVALELGGQAETPGPGSAVRLGATVEAGEVPAALVPGGCWQRAHPVPGPDGTTDPDGGAALVTCVVSPGFDFADFSLA